MNRHVGRRGFLMSLGAAGVAASVATSCTTTFGAVAGEDAAGRAKLKVSSVDILQLTGRNGRKALYLKTGTDAGLEGLYGPVDAVAAMMVDRVFKRRLTGQNPLAGEAFWDAMFRADRHSRGSHYIMALSAVDNVLWDLRAKFSGLPVYRLLGGSRDKVRAYASCLGFSQEPDALQAKARQLTGEGYRRQKWFVRSRGPRNGPEGVVRDVQVVRLLREAVGDGVDLMFDAFWQWDLNYALAWSGGCSSWM